MCRERQFAWNQVHENGVEGCGCVQPMNGIIHCQAYQYFKNTVSKNSEIKVMDIDKSLVKILGHLSINSIFGKQSVFWDEVTPNDVKDLVRKESSENMAGEQRQSFPRTIAKNPWGIIQTTGANKEIVTSTQSKQHQRELSAITREERYHRKATKDTAKEKAIAGLKLLKRQCQEDIDLGHIIYQRSGICYRYEIFEWKFI
jgi:hypothetical protein